MCEPATIIAIGSAVAGAAGKAISGSHDAKTQANMIEARNRATQEELGRQQGFQDQSGASFDNAMNLFSPEAVTSRLGGAKAGAGGFLQSQAPTDFGSIGTQFAPQGAQAAAASSIADAFNKGADRSANLGNLLGYDQFGFDNKMDLAGTGRELYTISNLAGNSARVSGLEQQVASNNAMRPPSTLGSLLSTAGQLGGYYAGKRGGISLPTAPAINP